MIDIDEVITELENAQYDGGGWMLVEEEVLQYAIEFLKQYRGVLNKPRSERLIDVLREVRGEK